MGNFTNRRKGRFIIALFLVTFAFSYVAEAQAPYGEQFNNYGFEEWDNEGQSSVEPKHWNSFMTASGTFASMMSQQINYSTETRPGSEGSRSARIYSREINLGIMQITANGNVTTGRIMASSMSIEDNYNFTQRSDDNFNATITSVPDSLSIWVCFRANDANSEAGVKVAIHGDADFQQLGDGGYYPSDMLCATANRDYKRTCAIGESLVWKRLTIPFTAYPTVCTDCRYILATFTTNTEAGGGSGSDEVFVDDICLIYNPTLNLGTIAQTEYMIPLDGSAVNVEIPFELSGSMSVYNLNASDNEVIAQLSDANGSFENPIELGRVKTNESGVIQGVIPANVEEGSAYRIRVVSTNYPMTSQDNGTNIIITREKVDAGTAYVTLYAQIVSPTAVAIKATPNEYTSVYHYVVMKKADADELTLEETMQVLAEDEHPLYDVDEWEWPIESDVVYCAIACGQNSEGEWGDISKIEFEAKSPNSAIDIAAAVLNVYPNPASEYLKVSSNANIDELSVFSIDGKMIYSQNVGEKETTIDMSEFDNGIYVVRMISNGDVIVRRIVKI